MYLQRILTYAKDHQGYIQTTKIILVSFFALISLFVSIYVLWSSPWTGFRFIYVFIPHLYLIPIILLGLWFPKSGMKLIGIILVSVFAFWLFAEIFGYMFSIAFVMLYTGLDLATVMVLLLYVKDRRLVEAVITDLIERAEQSREQPESGRFGGDFDAIITGLSSEDEQTREEAVDALSILADHKALFPLITAVKDDSPGVRRAAADALGHCHSLKAVKALMQALTDEDRYVRETAAEALGHLGEVAIPFLIKGLEDPDWRVRIGSVIACRVSSGTLPSLDLVIRLLSDESVYVRREVVKTLGRLGDAHVVPYLMEATGDSDPGVRLRALRAVRKLGTPMEIEQVARRCIHDPDGAVRMMAGEGMIHSRDRE